MPLPLFALGALLTGGGIAKGLWDEFEEKKKQRAMLDALRGATSEYGAAVLNPGVTAELQATPNPIMGRPTPELAANPRSAADPRSAAALRMFNAYNQIDPQAAMAALPGLMPTTERRPAPLITKPGDVLRDPNDPTRILAQNPAEQKPAELSETQKRAQEIADLMKLSDQFPGDDNATGKYARARLANLTTSDKAKDAYDPADPKAIVGRRDYWRNFFKPEVNEAVAFDENYQKFNQVIQQGTPTGHSLGITLLEKMVDPNSIVRPQDLEKYNNAQSALQKLQGQLATMKTGDPLLPKIKADIEAVADVFAEISTNSIKDRVSSYDETMKDEGVSLDQVVPRKLLDRLGRKISKAEQPPKPSDSFWPLGEVAHYWRRYCYKAAIMPKFTAKIGDATFEIDAEDEAQLGRVVAELSGRSPQQGSYIDNMARRVASGITLGFADEIAAKANEAIGRGSYDENVSRERARDAAFFESNPVSAIGAEIAGGVLSPANKAAGALSGLTKLGRYGQYALQGGLLGAAAGAGNSVEGERIGGAIGGGVLGAGFGTALPALMESGTAAAKYVGNKFSAPPTQAARSIYKAMIRDGMTPQDAIARLSELGDDAALADLGGNIRGLAEGAANMPGASLKAAEGLRTRMGGAGERLKQAALDAVGVNSVDDMIAARSRASAPLYAKVMKPDNVLNTRGMESDAQELLKMATGAVKNHPVLGPQYRDVPDNAMPVIDEAKKFIDGMIGKAVRAGDNNEARILLDAKSKILARADYQFPDYKAARDAWGGPQSTIDALEFIATTADNANDFSDVAKRLFGKPSVRAELQKLLPGDAFNKFAAAVERERVFADTAQRVLGNSRTAFRNAAQDDMGAGVIDAAYEAAQNPSALGLLNQIARGTINAMKRPPAEVADELAKPLFSQDPAVKQAALAELTRRTSLGSILNRPGMATLMGGARIGGYSGGLIAGGSNQ